MTDNFRFQVWTFLIRFFFLVSRLKKIKKIDSNHETNFYLKFDYEILKNTKKFYHILGMVKKNSFFYSVKSLLFFKATSTNFPLNLFFIQRNLHFVI